MMADRRGPEPDITVGDDGRLVAWLREAGTYKATFSSKDKTLRAASACAEFVEGQETTIHVALTAITGRVARIGVQARFILRPAHRSTVEDDGLLGTTAPSAIHPKRRIIQGGDSAVN